MMELDRNDIQPGGIWRHFKGKVYNIVAVATDTETMEEMVVYRDECSVWCRRKDEFLSLVDREKYPDVTQKYRFEEITEMAKSHKRQSKGQRLNDEEKQWIQENHTSGRLDDGTPWVGVPYMPDREPFTLSEIVEGLTGKKPKIEKVEE